MHSTHNKGKSVVADRFIRTLKNKIYKHMTAVLKNVYFDILNDSVDKYNNTCHRTIKIKLIDVKPDSHAEYRVESNEKGPKFKVGDNVSISKYKNILAKGWAPYWSEEVFVISNIKNTVPWIYVINDLNGEENVRNFDEKELQETNKE